jgi:hypothetical protein
MQRQATCFRLPLKRKTIRLQAELLIEKNEQYLRASVNGREHYSHLCSGCKAPRSILAIEC